MKKRMWIFAVLLCVMTFFCACGSRERRGTSTDDGSVIVTDEVVGVSNDKESDTPAESQTLLLGTLEENYELNDWVSRFNEEHPEYIIEVKVYGSGMLGDADGLNDLRMEIVSGAGPDLINFGSSYAGSFVLGNITEDLLPYMESDGMLSGGEYYNNIFASMQMGSELRAVAPFFSLMTFAGKASQLPELSCWDIQEMTEYYTSLPKKTMLFLGDNKISVFAFLCMETMDSFVNWEMGECSFDSQRFIDMITFTDYFSEGLSLEEDFSYRDIYRNNKALLLPVTVDSVYATALTEDLFGEKASFIGYPVNKQAGKKSGSLVKPGNIVLAIGANSTDKEAAWEFIKWTLGTECQSAQEKDLPVLKSAMQERFEKAMQIEETIDENGDTVPVVKAELGIEGESPLEVICITKEQAEQLEALAESADGCAAADREMYSIALEEIQMYLQGERSSEDTADVIQQRIRMYVGERE